MANTKIVYSEIYHFKLKTTAVVNYTIKIQNFNLYQVFDKLIIKSHIQFEPIGNGLLQTNSSDVELLGCHLRGWIRTKQKWYERFVDNNGLHIPRIIQSNPVRHERSSKTSTRAGRVHGLVIYAAQNGFVGRTRFEFWGDGKLGYQ